MPRPGEHHGGVQHRTRRREREHRDAERPGETATSPDRNGCGGRRRPAASAPVTVPTTERRLGQPEDRLGAVGVAGVARRRGRRRAPSRRGCAKEKARWWPRSRPARGPRGTPRRARASGVQRATAVAALPRPHPGEQHGTATAKVAASRPNAAAGLTPSTSAVASAGEATVATSLERPLSACACWISPSGTVCGISPVEAGPRERLGRPEHDADADHLPDPDGPGGDQDGERPVQHHPHRAEAIITRCRGKRSATTPPTSRNSTSGTEYAASTRPDVGGAAGQPGDEQADRDDDEGVADDAGALGGPEQAEVAVAQDVEHAPESRPRASSRTTRFPGVAGSRSGPGAVSGGKAAATESSTSFAAGSPMVTRTPSSPYGRTVIPAASQAAANSGVRSPSRNQTKLACASGRSQPWSASAAVDAGALGDEGLHPLHQLVLGGQRGDRRDLGEGVHPERHRGLAQRGGDRLGRARSSRPGARPGRRPWRTSAAPRRWAGPGRRARASGASAVADELAVGLVDHHQHVVGDPVEEGVELGGADGGAGGVVRRADQDHPGPVGDRGGHRVEVVGLVGAQRHRDPGGPVDRDHDRVGLEGAPGVHDLVARAGGGLHELLQHPDAARAGGEVLGRHAEVRRRARR